MNVPTHDMNAALFAVVNVLGVVASPKVFQRESSRRGVAEAWGTATHALDRFLEQWSDFDRNSDGTRFQEIYAKLLYLRSIIDVGSLPNAEMTDLARTALVDLGVPGPPNGWDSWDGEPQENL